MTATIAVDCHAHVFARGLDMVPGRRYTPQYDAPVEAYLDRLDRHGLSHGVLVQPSFLGTDNSYLVAALRAHPQRLRGIAVLSPDVPLDALQRLDHAGIVGVRLNLIGAATPALDTPLWRGHLEALHSLGWHVEMQVEAARLPGVLPSLLECGLPIVIDHFGKLDPDLGIRGPGFAHVLNAGRTGQVWLKLSGAYRNGVGVTLADAIGPLRDSFGLDRLVWGSDWPHTQFESRMDYDQARAALDRWLPDAADQRIVLGRTPLALYRLKAPVTAPSPSP